MEELSLTSLEKLQFFQVLTYFSSLISGVSTIYIFEMSTNRAICWKSLIMLSLTLFGYGGGGGGLRGPGDHIISCHSKTIHGKTFKLGGLYFLSIRRILDEFQQNQYNWGGGGGCS